MSTAQKYLGVNQYLNWDYQDIKIRGESLNFF